MDCIKWKESPTLRWEVKVWYLFSFFTQLEWNIGSDKIDWLHGLIDMTRFFLFFFNILVNEICNILVNHQKHKGIYRHCYCNNLNNIISLQVISRGVTTSMGRGLCRRWHVCARRWVTQWNWWIWWNWSAGRWRMISNPALMTSSPVTWSRCLVWSQPSLEMCSSVPNTELIKLKLIKNHPTGTVNQPTGNLNIEQGIAECSVKI